MKTAIRPLLQPSFLALAVLLTTTFAPPLVGQDGPRNGVAISDTVLDVSPVGDIVERVSYQVTQSDWNRLTKAGLGSGYFKRHLGAYRADWAEAPGSYKFESREGSTLSKEISITELGAARNAGEGLWELKMSPKVTRSFGNNVDPDGRTVATFSHQGSIEPAVGCISAATIENGLGTYEGKLQVILPKGATGVAYDAASQTLVYKLPDAKGTGGSSLRGKLVTRANVMSTAYKIYALGVNKPDFCDQWVARTVFTNSSTNVVKNLEVTYKNAYAEDNGVQRFPEIVPGQTVVSIYYPEFKPRIAENTSGSTSIVSVEWTYTDAMGVTQKDSAKAPIQLSGKNAFFFSDIKAGQQHEWVVDEVSNAPMLAAWVSENDMPVREVANTARRFLGLTPGTRTDYDVLEWLYNTMLVFDLVYKRPASRVQETPRGFDPKRVQTVYLPRDVIEGNAGSCIDLAIFYAAMAHCQGLEPYLMLVPGHCFPVIKLREQGFVGVETTLVMDGWEGGHGSWAQAVKAGRDEFDKWKDDPNALLLDLNALWNNGVHGPDLPPWPPDGLSSRGKDHEKLLAKLRGVRNTAHRETEDVPIGPGLASKFEGQWTGLGAAGGRDYTLAVAIAPAGRDLRLTLDATLGTARVVEVYEGAARDGDATLTLRTRNVTDTTTNERRDDKTTRAEVILRMESQTSVRLERIRRDRREANEIIRLSRN